MTFSIFAKLGKRVALDVIKSSVGAEPNYDAIRKWRERGRIPPEHAMLIMQECEKRGLKVIWPDDFTVREEASEAAE